MKTISSIVDVLPEHVMHVAEHMRRADADEVWALAHHEPIDALNLSLKCSDIRHTVVRGTEPVAIFGRAKRSPLDNAGVPWLLGTDMFETLGMFIARVSRKCIGEMFSGCKVLHNYVDVRNKKSIRWLKWCGFDFEEAKPYGVENLPFHYFKMGV